jgi:hypothetical protein
MVSHLIEQTGSAPFSGGTITPKAPTPNPNHRKNGKGKQKGQCGSWANVGAAAHLAGGVFQARTPRTFLDTNREAVYSAEIDRLQAKLNISDAHHAFSMQHVYAAQQNGSSENRPRSHYCGLHGWNNDHNGTECRDKRFTPAMRSATTHVGMGGNTKVGVPVGFVRPSPFTVSPFWPAGICLTLTSETRLTCSLSPCLLLPCSQVSSAKAKSAPMKIDERWPRQLCRFLGLRGLTLLSFFESQRLMCLSRCLSFLPHYPLDPLSLGLFPLIQCLLCLLFLFPCRSHRQG